MDLERFTAIVLLHARCTCSEATVTELVRLVKKAARCGALTSGSMVLYASDGRRRFNGGSTPARGQTRANSGSAAVLDAVRNGPLKSRWSPVFGCEMGA